MPNQIIQQRKHINRPYPRNQMSESKYRNAIEKKERKKGSAWATRIEAKKKTKHEPKGHSTKKI